jgi:hypothetical protein
MFKGLKGIKLDYNTTMQTLQNLLMFDLTTNKRENVQE